MKEFFSNKKVLIATIIIGLIIVSIIFYLTYKAGKQAAAKPSLTDIGNRPEFNELSETDKQRAWGLSQRAYEDMDGVNWGWDENLWNEIAGLSDAMLMAVNNMFNAQYEVESEETFVQWMQDENFDWDSFELQGSVDTIINRLTSWGVS